MATRKSKDADEEKGQELAPFSGRQLPTDIADELEGIKSLGYSEKSEDALVPILSILQDNSAEVKARHPKQIQGALPGMAILRALKKIIDIREEQPGLVVQPAGFQHMWVRWMGEPGEGRIMAQYPFHDRPQEAVPKKLQEGDDRETWVMPDGSRLVDTRYHIVLAEIDGNWTPLVIPFAGTNHTVSRTWTNIMKSFKLGSGMSAPGWFRFYQLKTHFQSRGTQSWYNYEINDLGWVEDKQQRTEGKKLNDSVETETIAADIRHEDQSDGDGDDKPKKDIPI